MTQVLEPLNVLGKGWRFKVSGEDYQMFGIYMQIITVYSLHPPPQKNTTKKLSQNLVCGFF